MIFDNEQKKNVALECKEFIKYLGILIDNNLTWKHQIDRLFREMKLLLKMMFEITSTRQTQTSWSAHSIKVLQKS